MGFRTGTPIKGVQRPSVSLALSLSPPENTSPHSYPGKHLEHLSQSLIHQLARSHVGPNFIFLPSLFKQQSVVTTYRGRHGVRGSVCIVFGMVTPRWPQVPGMLRE